MVRWLERNGYDVSYTTGVDTDRRGAELLEHKAFLSVGHDEYWSGGQRANVEAARDAGVNLAFFSGNEVFWKTRWENSIDGGGTPPPHAGLLQGDPRQRQDRPAAGVWTGTWRDPRFSPPADGGRPENALTGPIFTVNAGATTAIRVPAADGKMRFWRNTSVADAARAETATLPAAGRSATSGTRTSTTASGRPGCVPAVVDDGRANAPVLQDYGSTYGTGTATHNLTLYRAPAARSSSAPARSSGPGASTHTTTAAARAGPSRMQQATVNLFADMGVQPATLPGRARRGHRLDRRHRPDLDDHRPRRDAHDAAAAQVTITRHRHRRRRRRGRRRRGLDRRRHHLAPGRRAAARWTYTWTPSGGGTSTIQSRAVDDSGNLETPRRRASPSRSARQPGLPVHDLGERVDAGRRARRRRHERRSRSASSSAPTGGYVTGLRFYKGTGNTGTHVGHLWTAPARCWPGDLHERDRERLAAGRPSPTPVAITANTTYVASYHAPNGPLRGQRGLLRHRAASTTPPLRALRDGVDGGNGVYAYGPSGTFPTGTYRAENYWVDVVFETTGRTRTRHTRRPSTA